MSKVLSGIKLGRALSVDNLNRLRRELITSQSCPLEIAFSVPIPFYLSAVLEDIVFLSRQWAKMRENEKNSLSFSYDNLHFQ